MSEITIEDLPMVMTEPTARVKAVISGRFKLRRSQHRFRRACDQIVLLNRKMGGVLHRYHAARSGGNRSFRYKLRLRLAVVEGARNMFYEYANRKAIEIVELRRDLYGEIVEIVSDNNGPTGMSDNDDDFEYESDDLSESDVDAEEEEDSDAEMAEITEENNEI